MASRNSVATFIAFCSDTTTAQPNEQLFVTSDYTAPVLQVVAAMNPFWEPSIN